MLIYSLLFLVLLSLSICAPSCMPGENFCEKCNQLTHLCISCKYDVLTPDSEGGCDGARKCEIGKNYCDKCDSENHLCEECTRGYHPDENGGCAYIDFCDVSYRGECLKCIYDFLLIGGGGLKICKSANDDDFLNCKTIDYYSGQCQECEENFFLNTGDKRCTQTEHCLESTYGKCTKCINSYYLDHKNDRSCRYNGDDAAFTHCAESEDGKICSKCEDGYYFAKDAKCVITNYCLEVDDYYCYECVPGYHLSSDRYSCVTTEHCLRGDKDSGICTDCSAEYYLDLTDRQCYSNRQDDDLKYCKLFEEKCLQCESPFFLGKDDKCIDTQYCAKSEFGKCLKCDEGFYLGKDQHCSKVEHCIYSSFPNSCLECEDGYYLKRYDYECIKAEGDMSNCKESSSSGTYCEECKNGFYLMPSDHLCYSNKEEDAFYGCHRASTDGADCAICEDGYYLGERCSPVMNCAKSKGDQCLECEDTFCYNVLNNSCIDNDWVEYEENKFHLNCLRTNEEGTKCAKCINDTIYTLTSEGLCIDNYHCSEMKDGKCLQCPKERDDEEDTYYCLNQEFGCMKTFWGEGCWKCNDLSDFNVCETCYDGYRTDDWGQCVEEGTSN